MQSSNYLSLHRLHFTLQTMYKITIDDLIVNLYGLVYLASLTNGLILRIETLT